MRLELLHSPALIIERLGQWAAEQRRLRRLRGTPAAWLESGHIDSLELLELLRPLSPQIILDIGANVGTWTLLAKALYPEAQVHAFEPLEAHCVDFVKATRSLMGVTLHQLALGRTPAKLQMHVIDRSDASSLLRITAECTQHYGLRDEHTVTVPVERLDDILRTRGIPQPDLLKFDIQGYELEALRGAETALCCARAVLTEVSFVELYQGQCLFHDLAGFLAERGFHLWALGERTALSRPLLQTDALFVAESARPQLME